MARSLRCAPRPWNHHGLRRDALPANQSRAISAADIYQSFPRSVYRIGYPAAEVGRRHRFPVLCGHIAGLCSLQSRKICARPPTPSRRAPMRYTLLARRSPRAHSIRLSIFCEFRHQRLCGRRHLPNISAAEKPIPAPAGRRKAVGGDDEPSRFQALDREGDQHEQRWCGFESSTTGADASFCCGYPSLISNLHK